MHSLSFLPTSSPLFLLSFPSLHLSLFFSFTPLHLSLFSSLSSFPLCFLIFFLSSSSHFLYISLSLPLFLPLIFSLVFASSSLPFASSPPFSVFSAFSLHPSLFSTPSSSLFLSYSFPLLFSSSPLLMSLVSLFQGSLCAIFARMLDCNIILSKFVAQLTGAVEYTDYLCRGVRLLQQVS